MSLSLSLSRHSTIGCVAPVRAGHTHTHIEPVGVVVVVVLSSFVSNYTIGALRAMKRAGSDLLSSI